MLEEMLHDVYGWKIVKRQLCKDYIMLQKIDIKLEHIDAKHGFDEMWMWVVQKNEVSEYLHEVVKNDMHIYVM